MVHAAGLAIRALGLVVPLLAVGSFGAPLLAHFTRRRRVLDVYALVFALASLVLSLLVAYGVTVGGLGVLVYAFGGWPPPLGIVYEVDLVSALLAVVTSFTMLWIVLYSWWYPEIEKPGYYYALLLGMEAGLLGCFYTGDLFNFFVMLEVTSVSAYALVAYQRTRRALIAAAKYAFPGAVATTLYFLSVVLLYAALGTVNTADAALRLHGQPGLLGGTGYYADPILAGAASLALALWALSFKSAVFPNHFWLPDAHPEAPTPVSAALSGLVVNVGVYGLARLFYTVASPESILAPARQQLLLVLAVMGVVSALLGAVLMVVQDDVKRMLAYSTISHMGLLALGLSAGLASSKPIDCLAATVYHLVNHSVGKALLFLSTGILVVQAGTRSLEKMQGIGYREKMAALATVVGCLHLMGVPVFGGFFSKLALFTSLLNAGMPWASITLVASSAISAIAYMKLVTRILAQPPTPQPTQPAHPAGAAAKIAVLILALACLLLGVFSPPIMLLAKVTATQLSSPTAYTLPALSLYRSLAPG